MTKVIICEAVLSSTDQIAPETMLGPFLLSLLFKVTPFYYLKGFNNLPSPHDVFYFLKKNKNVIGGVKHRQQYIDK